VSDHHHPNVERLLAGDKLPEPMSFKDHFNAAQAQWVQPPLYNHINEEADRPLFTPMGAIEAVARFALCLLAVGLCAAVVTWPRFGAVLHNIFN